MATAAENKHLKRLRILDAATHLFLDRSVTDTAIDDVVKLAGVAKGTFYLYFRDKYDLLDQIVLRRTAALFTESCAAMREHAGKNRLSRVEQIEFLVDEIIARLREDRKVTALIDKRFSACFSPKAVEEYPESKEHIEYLTGLLTSSDCPPEEARRRLYVLADMVGCVCCDAILSERPFGIDELIPTIHSILRKLMEGAGA